MGSLNASPQYYAAEEKYTKAKTNEEKLKALYEMLRYAPKHKKSEDLLKLIKKRIAKIKEEIEIEEKKRKASFHKKGVEKQRFPMVMLLGFENSGKTFLFNKLTGLQKSSTPLPFETKDFEYGSFVIGGLRIIVVDSPSISNSNKSFLLGNSQVCDIVILCKKDEKKEGEIIQELKRRNVKFFEVCVFDVEDFEGLKQKIFEKLEVIRVFTKKKGIVSEDAIALKKGSTIKELAEKIHKELAKSIKCAKVWGKNVDYQGEVVGKDFELSDGDVVELIE
ncbi:MAG: TGS domain-containing protein [Candidatus Micrarchaeales archaeon]